MTCKEVEILLAAMMEGLLSDQESRDIESHLRSCESCRKALVDLRKTDKRVKGLEEVDPPPWLKTRVMARVREESEKKGFLRQLFYPLYIKVPIQALATVLIAVIAWNVYKTGEPEYGRVVPPAVVQEEQKAKTSVEPTKIEETSAQPKKETDLEKFTPEKKEFAPPVPRQEGQKKLPEAVIRERAKADVAAVAPSGSPGPAAAPMKDREAASGIGMVSPQERKEAMLSADGQLKQKTRDAAAGAEAQGSKKQAAPAAASPALSRSAPARPAAEMTLRVGNVGVASGVVENEVKRLGGQISEKQIFGDRITLTTKIGADQVEALRAKIRSMGDVRETIPDTIRTSDGKSVTIRIEIQQD